MLRADPGEDSVMRWTAAPRASAVCQRRSLTDTLAPLLSLLPACFPDSLEIAPSISDVLRGTPAMQFLFCGWEDEGWLAIHHGMKWPEGREADGKKPAEL